MKKQDLKAGVVYGYATGTSDYRTASPVIVLDAKTLWTWYRPSGREKVQWRVSHNKRYTTGTGGWSSYYGDHGYLVLEGSRYRDEERNAQSVATLKELYAEFAQTAGNPEAVEVLAAKIRELDGITMDVVNNRWIIGDYEEAKNEEAERAAARQATSLAERDRAAAEHALLAEVADAMSAKLERDVSVYTDRAWGNTRASINMEDLAQYFGLKTISERL